MRKNNKSKLDKSTPIYRIINVFEVLAMLRTNKLRIAKLACFEDDNEALDNILHGLQVTAGPCRGSIGSHWEGNFDKALESHNLDKHSGFVSSWTTKAESVAMWSLYSNDFQGVRIKTSIRKLRNSIGLYYKNTSTTNLYRKSPKEEYLATGDAYVAEVTYVNLEKIFNRIRRRKRAYDKLESKLKSLNIEIDISKLKYSHTNFLNLPREKYLIKDMSFSHENEIRAVIQVGKVDARQFDEIIDNRGFLPTTVNGLANRASPKDFSDMLFIDTQEDFIEEVCIDPRCPPFKKLEIKRLFESLGVSVTESSAFGYYPKEDLFTDQFMKIND
ncbi:MAG: hypothetical protein COB35_10405 [Gammaproteobacteria bacterium]|nr:MAG: hypothetical protein COB35_10405 [Gammaproteobacteria bacterium]